ncbi:hypothetical protein BV22DRAFT_9933 [Leucogyrophana mollusca]|uniref:Uncharacterized protein n=1 Tax=Leucogyrophana mollusca TaxID=85980 RepID=A0ACB8C033_9AGAM|nr:hypothetical protein BV22DRAFT_9933 [Leucogyrophana mollusca]
MQLGPSRRFLSSCPRPVSQGLFTVAHLRRWKPRLSSCSSMTTISRRIKASCSKDPRPVFHFLGSASHDHSYPPISHRRIRSHLSRVLFTAAGADITVGSALTNASLRSLIGRPSMRGVRINSLSRAVRPFLMVTPRTMLSNYRSLPSPPPRAALQC